MSNSKDIKFGCINTSTGEFQEGYIDDGQMKFKKPSLWSRFINAITPEPYEKEFLGTKIVQKRFMGIGNWRPVEVCVYREFNVVNGKTHKIWFEHRGEKRNFNKDAYDASGRLILE